MYQASGIQTGGPVVVKDHSWEPIQEGAFERLHLFPNLQAESLTYPSFSSHLSNYLVLLLVFPLPLDCQH